jgi:phosphopantothenoylcysteine decarboxylase/phosphopantothenate--cysteine ligase
MANGIADDFLTALILATTAPVLVAPAMNTNMWEHAAVRANVDRLGARGVNFVDPGEGYLACGWVGRGRLAEPETIVEAAERLLTRRTSLAGRTVLVTAGPTVEDLDPVRFVGNRSSGRMGFALAREAYNRGAHVILIAGPTHVEPPPAVELVRVRSAADMHEAVMARIDHADAVVMAAAVADYTPAGGAAAQKIEKGGPMMTPHRADLFLDVRVPPTKEMAVARRQVLDLVRDLQQRFPDYGVEGEVYVTAPGAGFDVETNQVVLITHEAEDRLPLMSKTAVAAVVIDRVERLLAASPALSASR